MKRNIAIFVMSPFAKEKKEKEYTDGHGFCVKSIHTNETALKYIEWKLARNNEKLDKVYAFVSQKVKADDLEPFKQLIGEKSYSITEVELFNNGDLAGSFGAVSMMFDVLKNDLGDELSNSVFHVDMTGGPRHASMLMLALLNMLTYYGTIVGSVIYTNLQNGIVEDARDLIEMFSLVGGTQEFISYGSVDQIKEYFSAGKETTPYMDALLDAMEGVSEAFKVCARYPEMQAELQTLSRVIEWYKKYLNESDLNSIGKQEMFFSKLLPSIEREYREILPTNDQPCDALKIIKWCLHRGFLQQAVTLYTEWIPVYLVENGIVKINDKSIREICEKEKLDWKAWQSHFIQSYKPQEKAEKGTFTSLTMTLKNNKEITVDDLLQEFGEKNKKLADFLNALIEMDEVVKKVHFDVYVKRLPFDNLIRMILEKRKAPQDDFGYFLRKRLLHCKVPSKVVLWALGVTPHLFIKEIFFTELLTGTDQVAAEKKTIAARVAVFKELRADKRITITISEKNFYEFLSSYLNCVYEWRHRFNHAAGNAKGKIGNNEIKQSVLNSLEYLKQ